MTTDTSPYIILPLLPGHVEWRPTGLERLLEATANARADIGFSDYDGHPLSPAQPGSVRSDFDFGAVACVSAKMANALDLNPMADPVGWYACWLDALGRGAVCHVPESLYAFTPAAPDGAGERQFDYVDPRNADVQQSMERTFTRWLRSRRALLSGFRPYIPDPTASWPVEISVVIPVRNRVATIAQAVASALAQQLTEADYNVIVVDNHSTDGTSALLRGLAADDPRLHVVTPREQGLGIGGCWNVAVRHPRCGRYCVQLDSDDLYSSPSALWSVLEAFHRDNPAMVVGSYRLTDFQGRELPPGIIDHREWTPRNGPNNLLRVNGIGAPRAFVTELVRRYPFPDVSYGEDYAMALRLTETWTVGRIYTPVYHCRRWEGNSDHGLTPAQTARNNTYKDWLRTQALARRTRRPR